MGHGDEDIDNVSRVYYKSVNVVCTQNNSTCDQ